MVGYNCFIIFQYYYLNIKILNFFENYIILKFFENFEILYEIFESFEIL